GRASCAWRRRRWPWPCGSARQRPPPANRLRKLPGGSTRQLTQPVRRGALAALGSIIADDLAPLAGAQGLPHPPGEPVADEVRAAVAEHHVAPAGVPAAGGEDVPVRVGGGEGPAIGVQGVLRRRDATRGARPVRDVVELGTVRGPINREPAA